MKSKYLKILISLILIVSLCLAFTVAQSYAVPLPIVVGGTGLAIGGIAWVIANAMGVNLDFSEFTGTTIGTMLDPFYNVSTTLQTSDFALIKGLRSGYDALRLSLAAYNAIKAGSENLITDEGITDNTSGIISYSAVWDVPLEIPFASVDWTMQGQLPTPDGGYITITGQATAYPGCRLINDNYPGFGGGTGSWYKESYPISWRYHAVENNGIIVQYKWSDSGSWQSVGNPLYNIPESTVTFDYDAGTIDIDYGSDALDNVTIIFPQSPTITPTSDLEAIINYINNKAQTGDLDIEIDAVPPTPIPTDAMSDLPFDQFIDFYGDSIFEKIDNQTQVIDTLGQSVGQYIEEQTGTIDTYGQSVVEGIENQTDVIDTVGQNVVSAVDDVTGAVDTAGQNVVDAVDNQTDVIDTFGQSVIEAIENQSDVIDTMGQNIEQTLENQTDAIDTYGQSVIESIENQIDVIDTVGQDVIGQLETVDINIQFGNDILSDIKDLIEQAVDFLESIAEGVSELVEEIVLGTEKIIAGILNQIPSLFSVILSPIKQAASIWHYVVDWIQSITGPFQFIWSMANGTSYYIVLPVYASLAAAVVLAFYKRFGK